MKALFYDWGGLNLWLFHAINAIHGDALDRFMLLGTRLAEHGNFTLYLGLLVLAALLSARDQGKSTLQLWLGVIAVFALGNLIDGWLIGVLKEWFSFPRPMLALPPGSVHQLGKPELSLQHSLPSGHTSFAMLICASLWPALNRYWRALAAAFVLWVGLSRISLGAHFPADVVAGALSCLLVVWLIRRLVQGLLR
ncbi:phosphatidylglycerophosphatase B [mine drainage metagenome]|uniref:Phosphatidylglycerophosphatase B n=1 Tax=mine drainage metagenome TaxID=410659 RepID=A0A1J5QFY7_9ZZZZ